MANKRVWYLYHYLKSPSQVKYGRAYFLIRELLKYGIDPIVIGASYNHFSTDNQQSDFVTKQVVDGVIYVRLKTPKYSSNGLKRIINMFSYSWSLLKLRKPNTYLIEKPDVIIASSVHPYHIFSAYYLAKRFNAKLIFEIRDIWPLSLNQILHVSKWHPLYVFTKITELFAYKFSDKIISVLPNAYAYLARYKIKKKNYLTISNGASVTEQKLRSCEQSEQIDELRKNGNFVILYAGSHGSPNCLDVIIDSAIKFKNHDDMKFVFLGDGTEKTRLMKKAEGAENIIFMDRVSRDYVPGILSKANICIISWKDIELYKYGVSPNKIFEYMLAKKPILEMIAKEASFVEMGKCGFRAEPESIDSLCEQIILARGCSKLDLEKLGSNARTYLEENFTYEKLGLNLANLINKV